MKKLLIAIGLMSASATYGQETNNKKYFLTRQECGPALELMAVVERYGETPLFTGRGLQFSHQGQPFTGGSMFFVNQETGTWSLISLYGDGTACMAAVGTEFVPYSD